MVYKAPTNTVLILYSFTLMRHSRSFVLFRTASVFVTLETIAVRN